MADPAEELGAKKWFFDPKITFFAPSSPVRRAIRTGLSPKLGVLHNLSHGKIHWAASTRSREIGEKPPPAYWTGTPALGTIRPETWPRWANSLPAVSGDTRGTFKEGKKSSIFLLKIHLPSLGDSKEVYRKYPIPR